MSNQNIIEINHLKKSFKGHEVLKGVSFNVKRGEIFSLLGSNGAGKTTTIKILSTLISKYEGEINVAGLSLAKNKEKIRGMISLTGQFASLDLVLTARQNMKTVAQLRGIKDSKHQIDGLLEKFSLTEAADKQVSTYSGGMKRRLDIAMSLIGSPQLIFLDEPTTGIDPQNRIAMWEIIKGMAAQGVTILLTTQYLEEAEALADTVSILDRGVIAEMGTVAELMSKHKKETLEQVFLSIVNKADGGQLNG